MHSKQVNGLPVISIAEGERLGTVIRTYFDPKRKRIVGFAFDVGGGFFAPEFTPRLDAECVRSVGPDALTVESKQAIHGEALDGASASLAALDDLEGRLALTRGGRAVGRVSGALFDQRTLRLTDVEVSLGRLNGSQTIPVEQVLTIGRDFVIVADPAGAAREVSAVSGRAASPVSD